MLRRHLWRVIALAALAAFMTTAALPTGASAQPAASRAIACPAVYPTPSYCYPTTSLGYPVASLTYKGWTYLNLNHCGRGLVCAEIYRTSAPAWRWDGTRWTRTSLSQGWVYVYPFSGQWRWAWTQETGWVAVSGERFELRNRTHVMLN